MRYRLTDSMESKRAQVMTPVPLANRLMDFFSPGAQAWLELGSGSGRIVQACLDRYSPSRYIGVEIDPRLLQLSPSSENLRLLQGDALSPGRLDTLLGNEQFDRVAGNPPYGIQSVGAACLNRISELCPGIPKTGPWAQLDLVFVLESLARLKRPGEAAFIVSAPLAEDPRLSAFRQALISSASEVECLELPIDVFEKKAEVQTYLLVARFGASRVQKIRLARLTGPSLDLVNERWIAPTQAAHRMDLAHYEFQGWNQALLNTPGTRVLGELGVGIVRGSRTKTQFDEMGIESFHTSDFPIHRNEVRFESWMDYGFQSAAKGDLLLPRVGSRCLDRQAMVTAGQRHYTEAVYRIRTPKRNQSSVTSWILSEEGGRWRQAAAKGSCAKHLTVASLMSMPVPACSR